MDLKKIINNLKNKKIDKSQILILFLFGVLLMVIAIPAKEKKQETMDMQVDDFAEGSMDSTRYTEYLEERLEYTLSQMEGAGEVICMVTLSSSAEQIIEKDREAADEIITESDSQGGERTTTQSSHSETTIYHGEEDGEPYVSKEISPKVGGVVVIAEGGGDSVVVKNITEAVQALFGIESHKIRIVKKGVNER